MIKLSNVENLILFCWKKLKIILAKAKKTLQFLKPDKSKRLSCIINVALLPKFTSRRLVKWEKVCHLYVRIVEFQDRRRLLDAFLLRLEIKYIMYFYRKLQVSIQFIELFPWHIIHMTSYLLLLKIILWNCGINY